jgi:hypothetical protein
MRGGYATSSVNVALEWTLMVKNRSLKSHFNSRQERRDDMARIDTANRSDLAKSHFAFPRQRKEPLEDAAHVRNAIARFNQVEGASAEEKDEAWTRIQAAAKKYGVELSEKSRHETSKG